MLTVGSLFSGIGGLDLGLERAGMEIKWQVENDAFCQAVLKKHWPDIALYPDIREVGKELEPVDLICGGFPCQDVSLAGKRKGLDGERSGLWREFARIIRLLRPRYVLVENVPGLLSAGFERVLGDLAESGYDAEWDCFCSHQFSPPTRRERVFVVAFSSEIRTSQGSQGIHKRRLSWEPGGVSREGWIFGLDNPTVCGMDDGVPPELDRNFALGNAVVPQVAEFIGRRILEFERESHERYC